LSLALQLGDIGPVSLCDSDGQLTGPQFKRHRASLERLRDRLGVRNRSRRSGRTSTFGNDLKLK
ncbi:MAG: hypothetical protein WCD54_14575, partial [Pseudolabrys sp.]